MSIGTPDILDSIAPYFPTPININDEEKIDELFAVFQRDFFDNPFEIQGKKVKVKFYPYTKHKRDGLPEFYSNYYEKFVHLITREVKGRTVVLPKQREFKEERANRIHWLKPILQHWEDPRITFFTFKESDDTIRYYFWYKAKSYMVIMETVSPDYVLITGFCVDKKCEKNYNLKFRFRLSP
jgi:hypothetical protein